MTITVEVDAAGIVRVAPPIVRKFKGQPLKNLIEWMKLQGNFKTEAYG
jgi:hypothetical protein